MEPTKAPAHGHKSVHKVKFCISFFMYFTGWARRGGGAAFGVFGGVPVCRSPRHGADVDVAAHRAPKMSAAESQTSKSPI